MSIRIKILIIVLGFFALIITAFAFYSLATTQTYKQMRLESIAKTVEIETEKVNKVIVEIGRAALSFADIGAESRNSGDKALGERLARQLFANLKSAVGGGFYFEPFGFDKNTMKTGVYVYKANFETGEVGIEDSSFVQNADYLSSGWYKEILAAIRKIGTTKHKGIIWTRPYVDDSGTFTFMTTAGAGIFDDAGNLLGLSISDWGIVDVIKHLSEIKPTKGSFVILCAPENDYIISNTFTMNGAGTLISELSWDINAPEFELNGNQYLSFKQTMDNGWLLAVQIPKKEIFAEIENRNRFFWSAAIFFCVIMLLSVYMLISRLINRPLKKLTFDIARLSGGDLNRKVGIYSKDEIGKLARAFNKMTTALKISLEETKKEHAEKERIGAELNVATQIQASMLPCIFPAFPERAEFDIYASMLPAKEVGGDFYDFFLIDENTLAVVIADVSGKGVPAALFMVIAKTLIKNNAQYGSSPKEVFETVNNMLCENNEAGMFVTAFMGYLDISSGKFSFVNAGHNPPLVKTNGEYNYLKAKSGFVIAGMEDMKYTQGEIVLAKDDELFLYTDGVTEAANNEDELFGEDNLLNAVKKNSGLELKEFAMEVKSAVDFFADGAEQADDITMLALRYKGK